MFYPNLEVFRKKARQGNLVPVSAELIADLQTPLSAFLNFAGDEHAFLLESAETGRGIGRYSFLGCNPILIFRSRGNEVRLTRSGKTETLRAANPLHILQGLLKGYKPVPDETLPPFVGGAVGYIGYDYVRFLEKLPELKLDELNLPDLYFMLVDSLVIFDRLTSKIKVVVNSLVEGDPEQSYRRAAARIENILGQLIGAPSSVYGQPAGKRNFSSLTSETSPEDFEEAVRKAQEHIRSGDIFQVVLSRRFQSDISCPPLDIYRALRIINPSPYMFYLKFDDLYLIGSSPEIMVQAVGDRVRVRPIAGTRSRGASLLEDARLEEELKNDPKEKAEHLMLVDLGRNDLGRVAVPGSVRVSEFMSVEKYSHVMHLVSNVDGKLDPSQDAFSVLAATFPAGTVTGAPKIRAMEIIEELEPVRRGPYAGAVGYFSFDGNLDTCITIRTLIVKDKTAFIQAGAGIVADSIPERENQECLNKAHALFKAVEMAQGGLK